MRHHTTSWKSHTSTGRWTAGNDGRSPAGGKARRVGGRPALARQKALREHAQRAMSRPAIPAPALVMVQAPRALGILVAWLKRPAAMRQLAPSWQRRVRREVPVLPLHRAACARPRTFAEPPALRPRTDTRLAGRARRATRGPVCPHGDALCAQDPGVTLAPGERVPAVRWEGSAHGRGLRERRGARLLRLAAPARRRWGPEGSRVALIRQAPAAGAAHASAVGDLPVVEALQAGRGVAIASVSDPRGQRDAPGPRLIHEGESPLRLGLQRDVRRDPPRGAARLLSGPGLGEGEGCREGPRHGGAAGRRICHGVRADDALAMGDLAQRPSIRAGDANGTAPVVGEAGIVQPPPAVGRTLRHPGGHALLGESLGIPGRLGQHRLSACGRGAGHRRSDGGAVRALQVCEPTGEGTLHALPAGRAAAQWREGFQRGGELRQDIGTGLRDHGQFPKAYYSGNISKGEYGRSVYKISIPQSSRSSTRTSKDRRMRAARRQGNRGQHEVSVLKRGRYRS